MANTETTSIPKDPVVSTFKRRMFNNDLDVLCPVVGKRGSTKSGCSVSLGWDLDRAPKSGQKRFFLPSKLIPREFKLRPGEMLPRIIYKPSDFLSIINQRPRPPKGTCIVWDETGVEGDSRDFMKKKNKLLKRTFETIRSFNYAIFLTAPTLKSFDVSYARVAAFLIKTMGKVDTPNGAFGMTKVYELDPDPINGYAYRKFIQYLEDGLLKKMEKPYYIRRPPAFLEEPYKRYKDLFQTKLYRDYENDFDDIESLEISPEVQEETQTLQQINKIISEIEKHPKTFYDFKKKKFVLAQIQYANNVEVLKDGLAKKIVSILNHRVSIGDFKFKQEA